MIRLLPTDLTIWCPSPQPPSPFSKALYISLKCAIRSFLKSFAQDIPLAWIILFPIYFLYNGIEITSAGNPSWNCPSLYQLLC